MINSKELFCSNLHKAVLAVDGQVYILNSGEYLMRREDIEQLIDACNSYLSHIEDEFIEGYNRSLYNKRKQEREETPKSISRSINREPVFIYLMFNKRNGYYKIGYSRNPKFREGTLQAEEPEVELIYSVEGSASDERILHTKFDSKRVRGEWFALTDEDVQFIKSL